jgi:hypothetical protein
MARALAATAVRSAAARVLSSRHRARRATAARVVVARASSSSSSQTDDFAVEHQRRYLASQLASLARSDPSSASIPEAIAALERARAPVDLAAFDGAWEVAWSEGTMAWRALVASAVQAIAGRCRAGQAFTLPSSDSSSSSAPGEALNFAELFDGAVVITARGVFRPKPPFADATRCDAIRADARYPIAFDVQIDGGDARVAGKRFDLPICGPGEFEVLYGDECVRVFRSSGGVAVQVPSDWTPPRDAEEEEEEEEEEDS